MLLVIEPFVTVVLSHIEKGLRELGLPGSQSKEA